jgi:hypothetical protein
VHYGTASQGTAFFGGKVELAARNDRRANFLEVALLPTSIFQLYFCLTDILILSDRIRQPKENQNPLTLPCRCDKLTYKLPSAG